MQNAYVVIEQRESGKCFQFLERFTWTILLTSFRYINSEFRMFLAAHTILHRLKYFEITGMEIFIPRGSHIFEKYYSIIDSTKIQW